MTLEERPVCHSRWAGPRNQNGAKPASAIEKCYRPNTYLITDGNYADKNRTTLSIRAKKAENRYQDQATHLRCSASGDILTHSSVFNHLSGAVWPELALAPRNTKQQQQPRAANNVEAKRPQNALSLTLRPNPYGRAGDTLTNTSVFWRDVFNKCRKGKTFLVSSPSGAHLL
ncbi:hypothetical protein AVEN_171601-1 [Araneus ventricosus]|uniref:Uncharacterized protein n=1 Tax=Araneus ventricosus TaxID=182803 RepID=A0A4Y2U6Z0_ARAVE|nr:hypothetical protein AVEN_171601-1 [Araneus ventricosus]